MNRKSFSTLAVVGAGNMGSGIAQKMAAEGFDVLLLDLDAEKIASGLATIERTLKEAVDRGIMRAERSVGIRERVRGTTRYEDLAAADLVVEAVAARCWSRSSPASPTRGRFRIFKCSPATFSNHIQRSSRTAMCANALSA